MAMTTQQQTDAYRFFAIAFGAAPGVTYMNQIADAYAAGMTTKQIVNVYTTKPQFTSVYPNFYTNAQFANALIENVVGTSASAAAKAQAKADVEAALNIGWSRGDVIYQIFTNLANKPLTDPDWGNTAKLLANQVAVARYYTEVKLGNTTDLAVLKSVIAGVTPTTDVSTTAALDAVLAGAATGQTFMLTTGADNITGTSGNDVINGSITYANTVPGTGSTLTVSDQIAGGAGTDRLNLTVDGTLNNSGAPVAFPAATISGVENVFIRNVATENAAADNLTVDASQLTGVQQIWSDRSTSTLSVTNLAAGAAVGVAGNGTAINGDLIAAYVAGATASALAVDGGTKAGAATDVTITGAGITSATITSTGAANQLDVVTLAATTKSLTIDATTDIAFGAGNAGNQEAITGFAADSTITIKGAGKVVLEDLDADVDVINAAENTGGVTVALDNETDTKFTGGSGNDTVSTGAALTTGSVDAGAGTGDRLILTNAAHVNSTTLGAKYTNFEILRNGATATQDASLIAGITSVETSASGAGFNKMTATQAAAVTNLVDNNGATFALADATGTSDALVVELKNSTATASADLTNVTVTGFETMTVKSSSGSSSDTNALSFAAAGDLTTLNLTGAKPISVSTTNITKAATINASALTFVPTSGNYALTLSGNLVKGSSVTGSDAADSITTTAAISGTSGDYVVYNAGAGDDAISATVAAINNTSGSNGSVKIDGGAGTDTLTFTDTALTLVDANFQYLTNIEKYAFTGGATGTIAITGGGFFDTNNKAAGATFTLSTATTTQNNAIDLTSFSGNAKVSLTANSATTGNQTITTGSGADEVTVSATSLTTGVITVNTGLGNDKISVTAASALTTGGAVINAGQGQDTITLSGITGADMAATSIVINAGHSTLTAFDSITGYGVSDGTNEGMTLDFDGSADAAASVTAGAVTGYTSAELTYSITNGVLSFAGTKASTLTNAQKADIAQLVVTAANAVVAWSDGTDAYVFHNSSSGDSLVKLVGITTVAGVDDAAANTTTANYIIVG